VIDPVIWNECAPRDIGPRISPAIHKLVAPMLSRALGHFSKWPTPVPPALEIRNTAILIQTLEAEDQDTDRTRALSKILESNRSGSCYSRLPASPTTLSLSGQTVPV
jgi:hypothetical protein